MYKKIFLTLYLVFCFSFVLVFIMTLGKYLSQSKLLREPIAQSHLEDRALSRIHTRGFIRFVALDRQKSFNPFLQTHVDYLLVEDFAREMQLDFELTQVNSLAELHHLLAQGKADIAVGMELLPGHQQQNYIFSKTYRQVKEYLLHHKSNIMPQQLGAIKDEVSVVADSYHALILRDLKLKYPKLKVREYHYTNLYALLDRLNQGTITYTIANDQEYAAYQHIFPEISPAFILNENVAIGWAINSMQDKQLLAQINERIMANLDNGNIQRWVQEQKQAAHYLNYYDTRAFLRSVDTKLNRYINFFKDAAHMHALDWKLLAAMSYQESHWNPRARSPTGVRGMMMLTTETAAHMGVTDRTNARQSIYGGAEYFTQLKSRLADRISEPDKTWFALAAYNIGLSHVRAARKITEKQGQDSTRWSYVSRNLHLLSQENWYHRTLVPRRIEECLNYVNNIRSYYRMMIKINTMPHSRNHPVQSFVSSPELLLQTKTSPQTEISSQTTDAEIMWHLPTLF